MFYKHKGFTLLEILIALFIVTILSVAMVSGLHTVMNTQSSTDLHAERLRNLQKTLLIMSSDIKQVINRPVLNTKGKEEIAFIGTSKDLTFTYVGLANEMATVPQSNIQRVKFYWYENALWRMTWNVLDQAPETRPHAQQLLADVSSVSFQYLNKDGKFLNEWPEAGQTEEALPRAVRITITISQWGKISQLYAIYAEPNKLSQPLPQS